MASFVNGFEWGELQKGRTHNLMGTSQDWHWKRAETDLVLKLTDKTQVNSSIGSGLDRYKCFLRFTHQQSMEEKAPHFE